MLRDEQRSKVTQLQNQRRLLTCQRDDGSRW